MEPDTLMYDADAAAWENWQVAPEAACCDPDGTLGAGPCCTNVLESTQAYDAEGALASSSWTAGAPTLNYDTAGMVNTLVYDEVGGLGNAKLPGTMPYTEDVGNLMGTVSTSATSSNAAAAGMAGVPPPPPAPRQGLMPPPPARVKPARSAEPGQRLRLHGKQPRPRSGFYAAAVAAAPAASPRGVVKRPAAAPPARAAVAARPAREVGAAVKVKGDGWGSGRKVFTATVIEEDDMTYSIVFENARGKYEETVVLKEHCVLQHKARRQT